MGPVVISDDQRRVILREYVRELRVQFGSDRAIERASGINYTRLSRWGSGGDPGISLDNLIRLAAVSGHTLGDMLMALYGVLPDQLRLTATTAEVGAVVAGGTRLAGRYRLLLLMPQDDAGGGPQG